MTANEHTTSHQLVTTDHHTHAQAAAELMADTECTSNLVNMLVSDKIEHESVCTAPNSAAAI